MKFYPCTLSAVVRETDQCVSLLLNTVQDYPSSWLPGQHVLVSMELEGKEKQGCFSISQPDFNGQLRLTVKDNGQQGLSNFINNKLAPGASIDISEPRGKFRIKTSPQQRKSYYFFAAGSGITPIFSMMSAVLAQEPESFVYCLYGNRQHNSIIFRQALEQLGLVYGDRLVIEHMLSSASWISSFSAWRYGRIDGQAVLAFIQQNPPYAQDCEYYICGPGSFIQHLKAYLTELDVPQEFIFSESFTGQVSRQESGMAQANLMVKLDQGYQIQVKAGQTLLDAMLSQGIDAPFSCQAGVCGSCACKLEQGKVRMQAYMALDEQQLKENMILACQSVPESEQLEISYTNHHK